MESAYKESRMVMPMNLAVLMAVMMVVTWASMAVTKLFMNAQIPDIALIVSGAAFALVIVFCFIMRFTIEVFDDRIEFVYFFRRTSIPKSEIIDTRVGEINIIKNYSAWTLKGVKYKTYTAIGEDMGIGLKVTGKRVFFLSSADPDAIAALLPKE